MYSEEVLIIATTLPLLKLMEDCTPLAPVLVLCLVAGNAGLRLVAGTRGAMPRV